MEKVLLSPVPALLGRKVQLCSLFGLWSDLVFMEVQAHFYREESLLRIGVLRGKKFTVELLQVRVNMLLRKIRAAWTAISPKQSLL